MKSLISAAVALFAIAAMSAPAVALVPFEQSNFYNEKCKGIAVYNSSCTVQSMNQDASTDN